MKIFLRCEHALKTNNSWPIAVTASKLEWHGSGIWNAFSVAVVGP